jgi:predicted MPP superfamily phosphohydrolase
MLVEFGASGPLAIREEAVRLGLSAPVRVLYVSDLHLGRRWTARVSARLAEAAASSRPDLILLGGDLVDTARATVEVVEMVATLAAIAPVYAVPGNHDEWVGSARVRDAVRAGGGRWLPDDPAVVPVRIDGTLTAGGPGPRVLCGHDPAVFPSAVEAGYGLVLAGHLHGGQCVLSGRGGKQYPAAWFNRWHGLRFADRGAVMLVSRGAADTFPVRVNCPREVILCELT